VSFSPKVYWMMSAWLARYEFQFGKPLTLKLRTQSSFVKAFTGSAAASFPPLERDNRTDTIKVQICLLIQQWLARRSREKNSDAAIGGTTVFIAANMTVGQPEKNSANLQNTSRAEAAKLLNVSERSVNTAKKIERQGGDNCTGTRGVR
jgi:ABC-type sugar transport system ATPase subunit